MKLAKEQDLRLYFSILLLYYAFMRPIEIQRLYKSDFDLNQMTLEIRAEVSQKRTVNINKEIATTLIKISNSKSKYALGEKLNPEYIKTKFKRFKIKHNLITLKLYDYKHIGCSKLYEATKDIILIQRMCGHQKVSTTKKYLNSLGFEFKEMDKK